MCDEELQPLVGELGRAGSADAVEVEVVEEALELAVLELQCLKGGAQPALDEVVGAGGDPLPARVPRDEQHVAVAVGELLLQVALKIVGGQAQLLDRLVPDLFAGGLELVVRPLQEQRPKM